MPGLLSSRFRLSPFLRCPMSEPPRARTPPFAVVSFGSSAQRAPPRAAAPTSAGVAADQRRHHATRGHPCGAGVDDPATCAGGGAPDRPCGAGGHNGAHDRFRDRLPTPVRPAARACLARRHRGGSGPRLGRRAQRRSPRRRRGERALRGYSDRGRDDPRLVRPHPHRCSGGRPSLQLLDRHRPPARPVAPHHLGVLPRGRARSDRQDRRGRPGRREQRARHAQRDQQDRRAQRNRQRQR